MGKLATAFGARVKALRRAKRLTQTYLADACNISEEWVRRIERGDASPSFDTIEKLAKALKVQPAQLFEGRAENPALERLLIAAERLSTAEIEWLNNFVDLMKSRPH